ncbi:MAG TPA: tetratricopeptide repeat protein [Chthoniobacterales bacterium]
MTIRKFMGIVLLLLTPFVALGATPEKSELEATYDKAFRAFDSGNYDEALKALDAVDKRQPDLAESLNLRGVVYMRQKKYDKAETALRKAISIEPKFWNASFNLAEIPFLKKDWQEARNRFEALVAGENQNLQPETGQLIQYKILLTFVLQGKENTVDWIMNKFESAKDSPALYFSNAALAFQHDNQKEANEWLSAAKKHFSEPLNKLYAESFYEIGWMQKPPGESRAAIEITSATERAERLKADAKANFEKAERAFEQHDFDGALKSLDLAEAAVPNEAPYDNLRGEILMEQGKFDEAEVVLRKAFTADPKFREAQYNLAQIPFKKGEYAEARDRFEALFGETPGDDKNQASQLIKYKIFLTLLLDGKENEAQQLMDQFKFTGDTPALYYAHAAWEFKHGHEDEGSDWVSSARKIYSPPLNLVFADSLYDLGWLKKSGEETSSVTLAQADASPAGPTPAMRLGQSESLPAPGAQSSGESPAATVSSTPAPAGASPAATTFPVVAAAKAPPEESISSKVGAAKSPVKTLPKTAFQRSPATAAPTKARGGSSTWAEIGDRMLRPGTLLAGSVLLAGILLLVWLVVQQARRNLTAVPAYQSPGTQVTRPALSDEEASQPRGQHNASRDLVSTGPPKLSLNLKGSEPSVRAAVLPSTARGLAAAANGPAVSPNESTQSEAESQKPSEPAPSDRTIIPPALPVTPAPAVAKLPQPPEKKLEVEQAPLRDKEEVSLPAVAATETAVITPIAKSFEKTEAAGEKSDSAAAEVETAARKESDLPQTFTKPESKKFEPEKVEPELAKLAEVEATHAEGEKVQPAEVEPVKVEAAKIETPISEPLKVEAAKAEDEAVKEAKTEPEEPFAKEPKIKTGFPFPVEEEEEPVFAVEEPIGQGAPVPELTTALAPEPVISELAQPEPESPLELIEPEEEVAAPIAGRRPIYSPIETPSFASKIISTESIRLQSTTPVIMPETTITPASVPAMRPAPPTVSVQQPVGGMRTTVQLTFSLEIASMQLTPTFKMSGLQLKPISRVVSMRLAPSQDPQPPMNLQVTFEVAKIELTNGAIGTVRLLPSIQQKPAVLTSPSFSITGLELVSQGAAPVQLTPTHQEQASVHLTAEFQIAAIEFTPLFEIATIVLNSTSKKVFMQLPGSGPSSIDSAPVFEIENVQLGGSNELDLIQVAPSGGLRA